jgi:hypothetical protein
MIDFGDDDIERHRLVNLVMDAFFLSSLCEELKA